MSEYALNQQETIYLFKLSSSESIGFDSFYFCAESGITYLGNTYTQIPYLTLQGLSYSASGVDSEPTLTLADDGLIGFWVNTYKHLLNFEVAIKRIKKVNLANSNPLYQTPPDVFIISQKPNYIPGKTITFKLAQRATFRNQIPARLINGTCSWKKYRGAGCNYAGSPMFDINDNPTQVVGNDVCGLTLDSCRVRGNVENFSGIPTIDNF